MLMTSFSQVCEKETIKFHWETASERDVDYFVVEETRDGTVFFPLGKVEAIGTSEEVNSYTLVIEPIVFHLTNQLGQTISNSSAYADNLKTSVKTLSPRVYYIRCISILGKTEVKKFIISKN